MTFPTLLDIAKHNGSDAVAGLIEESIQAHPELMLGYSRTIMGTQYKTLVRTGIPTVGFRNANEGSPGLKSTYENRLVETFISTPRIECDKAVADAHEDGWQAFMAIEGSGVLEGTMRTFAKQFYYGRDNGGDAKGHPGLIDAYDATNMVVDAGGSTDATATSVWLVKFGPKDVGWVWGQSGEFGDLEDVRVESITDGDGNRFSAYVSEGCFYPGVQVGSINSVVRIKKITADTGKTLTDDLIYEALGKFPTGVTPDLMLMTRRSLHQLRNSRTATNQTGAPAPIPTEVEGVPIHQTDAILNTELLAL